MTLAVIPPATARQFASLHPLRFSGCGKKPADSNTEEPEILSLKRDLPLASIWKTGYNAEKGEYSIEFDTPSGNHHQVRSQLSALQKKGQRLYDVRLSQTEFLAKGGSLSRSLPLKQSQLDSIWAIIQPQYDDYVSKNYGVSFDGDAVQLLLNWAKSVLQPPKKNPFIYSLPHNISPNRPAGMLGRTSLFITALNPEYPFVAPGEAVLKVTRYGLPPQFHALQDRGTTAYIALREALKTDGYNADLQELERARKASHKTEENDKDNIYKPEGMTWVDSTSPQSKQELQEWQKINTEQRKFLLKGIHKMLKRGY